MTKDNTNFIDPSKKTLYGKHGAEFWIGKIVAYADQKEQIEEGFGWRYKVIILGDNSETDQVEDKYYSYASVLLPTTAGTGAAYKLRSVRLSQGDLVFGVRGAGTSAPKFIIGAIPRTRKTAVSSGKFGTLSGFYGSLTKNDTLDGEHNEQIGPKTPDVQKVKPEEWTKATAKPSSDNLSKLGYDNSKKGDLTEEETKTKELKKTIKTGEEYVKDKEEGKGDAVNNEETLKEINEAGLKIKINPNDAIDANKVAVIQGLQDETTAKEKNEELTKQLPEYKGKVTDRINEIGYDDWEKKELAKLVDINKVNLRSDGKLSITPEDADRLQERKNVLKDIERLEKSIKFDTEFQGTTISTISDAGEQTTFIPPATKEQIQSDKRKLLHLTKQLKYLEDGGLVRNNDYSLNDDWAKVKFTNEFPDG